MDRKVFRILKIYVKCMVRDAFMVPQKHGNWNRLHKEGVDEATSRQRVDTTLRVIGKNMTPRSTGTEGSGSNAKLNAKGMAGGRE